MRILYSETNKQTNKNRANNFGIMWNLRKNQKWCRKKKFQYNLKCLPYSSKN